MLNKKLKELDLAMAKIMENIRKVEPGKKDLESLFSLYQMTLKIYNDSDTIYKLLPLQYTDLDSVYDVLCFFGYLKPKNKDTVDNQKATQDSSFLITSPFIANDVQENQKKDNNLSVQFLSDTSESIEDIFVEQKNPFNSNGPVYAFTNEALSQYMKKYDFEGKSVLASLGSGDFALNAYLLGAEEVETFDINQYTYYFYQLKKALIMKYDFFEFCNLIKNPQEIFKRFNEYNQFLDSESISFFSRFLKKYNNNIINLLNKFFIDKVGEEKNQWNESNTFDSMEELFLIAQYKNFYLQSLENYNKLKQQLANHYYDKFYFADLYEFIPNKKYDIIYLSNIGDYSKSEDEFKDFIIQLREKLLNENGIIIIVSITNHIIMGSDVCERTKMNWDDMEEFNRINEVKAYLPICNLGIQNVYTTYPYQSIKHRL